jgi:tripeptidyl-peptidase I
LEYGSIFIIKGLQQLSRAWTAFHLTRFPSSTTMILSTVLLLLKSGLAASLPQDQGIGAAPGTLIEHERAALIPTTWRWERNTTEDDGLTLRIALKEHRDVDKGDILARSDPNHILYGQFLNAAELAQYLDDASSQVSCQASRDRVKNWLDAEGVTILRETSGSFDIRLPAAKAQTILGAGFSMYARGSEEGLFARTEAYSLPQSVSGDIDYVFPTVHFFGGAIKQDDGFTGVARRQQGLPTPPFDCTKYICPVNLTSKYNIDYIPSEPSSSKLGIASFLEEYPNRQDWSAFISQRGLSDPAIQAPYDIVSVNGGESSDTGKAGIEAMLDLEYTSAFTGPLNVTYYSVGGRPPTVEQPGNVSVPANQSENEPYLEFLDFLLTQDDIPQVISISYTDDEQTVPYSYASKVCERFSYLALRGVTVLVASGDAGVQGTRFSDCEGPDGEPRFIPTFPASCPWVTTVGATAAYGGAAAFSSGGFSNYFERPAWQHVAVQNYVTGLENTTSGTPYFAYNTSGRGYPDLTLLGVDYLVTSNNFSLPAKGTSASTPVVAAMVALLNALRLKKSMPVLGFLNPILYASNVSSGAIDDVTEGIIDGCSVSGHSQPGFAAAVGWDAASGLGAPDFVKLRQILV